MNISENIKYVGVNDHDIDLFEGQFEVPLGMAYNSYVILDDKIAVVDSVEHRFSNEWLANIKNAVGNRPVDYLIIQHMEPDHSSSILSFLQAYPEATVVSSDKALTMMANFYKIGCSNRIVVKEGDILSLGKHTLHFITAPMVHWPEVIMTYDDCDKVLFSADAFGKFGANDVVDPEGWACEARRYYFGIVGKYGIQVQNVLKKVSAWDIKTICSLHGPVLDGDLAPYLTAYATWSGYQVESDGVVVAYTSVYGNTQKAAELMAKYLKDGGCKKVALVDLIREDLHESIEDAFRYGTLVLASTTYNNDVFPKMKQFIEHLVERNYQNRKVAFIENGSWAPNATKVMKTLFASCKNLTYAENNVTVLSALNEKSDEQISLLAKELLAD
ncbi:MAG: FprA family A-type flavoprotein [Christensenellales bacterium]